MNQDNKLSKSLVCVVIRNGIEIWVEKDRAIYLETLLTQKDAPQFITYDGQMINKADITGIFTAEVMEEKTRRRNGQWKCQHENWHERGEKCDCISNEIKIQRNKQRTDFYQQNGFYPLN